MAQERVTAYIDGYNLYHGLKSKGWKRYLWLDLHKFCESLLLPNQDLTTTKYFTARISSPSGSVSRQTAYIDALDAGGCVLRYEGKFQPKPVQCRNCGHTYTAHEEKQTDENIAVEMVRDAYDNAMDMALLISADSDLKPPVTAVLATGRRVIVACPPARFSDVLTKSASGSIPIYRRHLANNQMPNHVTTATCYVLQRPSSWY